MTIYSSLLALGYTDEQLREASNASAYKSSRSAGIVVQDTPDGVPLVGISYSCDFRSEEETGVSAISKAINNSEFQEEMIKVLDNGAVIFATQPVDEVYSLNNQIKSANDHFISSLPYVRDSDTRGLSYRTINYMREFAKKKDISLKGLRTKEAILLKLEENATVKNPDVWPAWFHYGNLLIVRATHGVFADVIKLLAEEVKTDSLAVSSAGRAFGSGVGIYSKADVGPKLQAEWDEEAAWTKHHEELLEPVKAELKSRGHDWFYLGGPKLMSIQKGEPKKVRYWLNGNSYRGMGQPFGWYTLEDLLAEKFMDDLKVKHESKEADKEVRRVEALVKKAERASAKS